MTDFRTRKRDKQVFPTSSGKEYHRKDDYTITKKSDFNISSKNIKFVKSEHHPVPKSLKGKVPDTYYYDYDIILSPGETLKSRIAIDKLTRRVGRVYFYTWNYENQHNHPPNVSKGDLLQITRRMLSEQNIKYKNLKYVEYNRGSDQVTFSVTED